MTGANSHYRAHLFFCTNIRPIESRRGGCGRYNSEALAKYLKVRVKELGLTRVRVNTAGCLHRCALEPVMVIYPEAVWYSFTNEADLDEILTVHLIAGGRVARLICPEQVQLKDELLAHPAR
ncbi:MAG: (2Fe-2S) ferredoxin domain-containing protein [Rhodospirillaceae bacterium]